MTAKKHPDAPTVRFVAIGDSFSEGVGDELDGGITRGWADLAAQGWANGLGAPIEYANFAIRGKLAWPIVDEQLDAALALKPTHLSFNGGGNDMLRPGGDLSHIAETFSEVLRRCDDHGVQFIALSGANPTPRLPLGRVIQRRGDGLSSAVMTKLADRPDVLRAMNWHDRVLATGPYWAPDRLHMNAAGHHRVAARFLQAVGIEAPREWWRAPDGLPKGPSGLSYYREHVGPWVKRRVTKTSSGDGRTAKYPEWVLVEPQTI